MEELDQRSEGLPAPDLQSKSDQFREEDKRRELDNFHLMKEKRIVGQGSILEGKVLDR